MNYWLLTTEYPPFFGGGISTYCFFTARMFVERGHKVTVFVNDASVNNYMLSESGGLRVVRFNPNRTRSSAFLGHVTNVSFEFAAIVREFIEQEGAPDLIEAQEYLGVAYYLLQFKHLRYEWCKDVPVVITMHSPSFLYLEHNHVPLYKYPNYWIGEMERFCMQAADLVISPTQYLLDETRKRFDLYNTDIEVVPNPYLAEYENETNSSGNQIVFYGKLSAQKGTFKLLRYFKDLWDGGFSEPLYLIGGQDIVYHPEGKMMGELVRSRYANYIHKGLLHLEDKIAPDEREARLSKAGVVLVPSTVENLPYVLFEQMDMCRVALVSKQGGHSEVVQDGVNGFVFDHEQPETFSEKLLAILKLTKEQRIAITQRAKETLRLRYSLDAVYAQKYKVLENLLHKRQEKVQFPYIRSVKAHAHKVVGSNGLLTVVVPFYNMGAYVSQTIASIQQSDYPNKEILIINDGSTDADSLAQLEVLRQMPGIRVISTSNKGLAHARNIGAENAKGEYLAFLDADDTVEAAYYSKAIKVLQHYVNVHFVGCWTRYFEGATQVWPTFTPEPPIILNHNTINSSALVYKRSSFLAIGKNDREMVFPGLEDYESVVAMVAGGRNGVVLPEVLFNYRVRKDSMIRGISKNKKLYLYQYISNKHKEFYASFAAENFNLINSNGAGIFLDNPTLDYHLMDNIPFNNKVSKLLISIIKKNKYAKSVAYKFHRMLNK